MLVAGLCGARPTSPTPKVTVVSGIAGSQRMLTSSIETLRLLMSSLIGVEDQQLRSAVCLEFGWLCLLPVSFPALLMHPLRQVWHTKLLLPSNPLQSAY